MSNYTDLAVAAETFIQSNRLTDTVGTRFKRTEDSKPVHTLYHGDAGIILFYLELFRFTEDKKYLETASQTGDNLLSYVLEKAATEAFITIGFYSGWPGYVFVLNELAKATQETRFKEGACAALARIDAQASPQGSGIGWIEPMPFSDITGISDDREVIDLSVGAAGTGLIYLYAYREGLIDSLTPAIQTADRLIEVAQSSGDGLSWLMTVDMPFPFTAPNFAHGGAGVAYFLADLYVDCQDTRYLEAAQSGANYVMSRSSAQTEGHLVCHNEEQQPASLFYLGVCHGPAGTGRLMYLLSKITQEQQYLDWLKGNFDGLVSTGAPEQRSKGLWQNLGQCCGDAGIGDYALYLYTALGDEVYLSFAERVAAYLSQHAVTQDQAPAKSWASAEHRSKPEFLEQQTGYMQGAAGIGSFFLHLASVKQNKPCKIVLPETPFR